MKKYLFLLIFLVSCGQDYNSNYFDSLKYSDSLGDGTPAGERFQAAYNILASNCISCHTGYHNSYSSFRTSSDWIDNGLVVQGDFENSFLVRKLKNYGGTMPQGGSSLGGSEMELIKVWIENL